MQAQSTPPDATTAPPELLQAITQIDAAANQENVAAVMQFYSPQFKSSDGLTYETMQEALKKLWEQYDGLTYATKIDSWKQDGNAIVAETTTTITGKHKSGARDIALEATITSQQRFEGQKITEQTVLDENSRLTSGSQPPTLDIKLPDQVAPSQDFDFDVIVTEPLGDRLLLGSVIDEPINAEGYLNPSPISLELLSAGGLFKVGKAPATPDQRWISAVIVRDDGITAVTRRLKVQSNP